MSDIYNPSGGTGGGSGALTPTQQAAFNNGPALMLPKFRAAIGQVKSGTGNCRVLCVGDSITSGAYSSNSVGATADWKQKCWVNQLAKLFNSRTDNNGNVITPAFSDSFMGFADPLHDARLVFPSPWANTGTTDPTVGGPYAFSFSGTSTMAYTPVNPVDTFKLWYLTIVGAGSLQYNLNGGSNTTINQNVATSFTNATISGSVGINTLNMKAASGAANAFVCGVEAWNSTISSVQFINAGYDGATTTNWNNTTNVYNAGNFATLGANLTIISLGINDILPSNGPIAVATTSANIQAFITSAQTTGDVLLICENPAVVASTQSLANQALYWNAVKTLANSNDIPLVSIFDRWVSYEYSNPLGYYMTGAFPINLHPNGQGYADYAQAIFNVIGNV